MLCRTIPILLALFATGCSLKATGSPGPVATPPAKPAPVAAPIDGPAVVPSVGDGDTAKNQTANMLLDLVAKVQTQLSVTQQNQAELAAHLGNIDATVTKLSQSQTGAMTTGTTSAGGDVRTKMESASTVSNSEIGLGTAVVMIAMGLMSVSIIAIVVIWMGRNVGRALASLVASVDHLREATHHQTETMPERVGNTVGQIVNGKLVEAIRQWPTVAARPAGGGEVARET